ncbi:hypothetical protein ACLB2K_069393 [Fragaria x ananassa]
MSPPPSSPSSNYLTTLGLGYAIAIALGFLVLLSTLLLASYICCRVSRRSQTQTRTRTQNPNSSSEGVILPRIIFVAEDDDLENPQNDDDNNSAAGLHHNVINSYPKFPFSKELGGGDASTCSICLCDYREFEMLRMMPECRHHFHLMCLDAWLKLNGSCPVCRNSPLPTPLSTPLQEVVPLSQHAADRRWRRIVLALMGLENLEWDCKFVGIIEIDMRKPSVVKLGTWRGVQRSIFILGSFALLISIVTLASKFYSLKSFHVTDTICNYVNTDSQSRIGDVRITLETVIQKLQQELNKFRDSTTDSSSSAHLLKHSSFLADILGLVESVHESLVQNEETAQKLGNDVKDIHPLLKPKQQSDEPADYFLIEEIRKYVKIKPNRLGKQNFMGANGTFTSIGHACFAMKKELEEYMTYDIGDICNDDWKLAQKLMVHGCDPLPRRRCFSIAPKIYSKPFPITESLWKLPDNRNVRWSHYRCKNFTCLASNSAPKGFFKCADCFNLSHHEMPRWMKLNAEQNLNQTADFLIPEVLQIKPGEIRIGLDFSVGTGTFAARMREFNVTIVSATINLGAPFNEMIALRGLVPLYLTINQRLPFFDNTLDLIHTTRFLDGWIDFVLLDFVLFDWDRVLRPGGLLWIDSFFCVKEDLNDYLESLKMLRYKKHKWVIVPKIDKDDDKEVFFSAVLEKPPRPFR